MNFSQKKILYYTGSLSSGGAERQLIYTALAANELGYKVAIVIDHQINHYKKMLKGKNIEVKCTSSTKKTPLKRFTRLMKITKEYKPDIFHSFLSTKNIWGMLVARINKVPVRIASIRNTDKKAFIGIRLYKKWATNIICNSKLAMKIANEHYKVSKEKLEVIYNAINLDKFKNTDSTSKKNNIRKELNLSKNIILGVTVARVAKQKNHLELIKALTKLNKKGLLESIHYLLIGNASDKVLFNKLNYEIGNTNLEKKIIYLGVREDVPEILNECDFMVLPSLYEGFPNVLMEAMATKTFVIATPVGGTPELIDDNVNGYLSDSTSHEDIAHRINDYLSLDEGQKEEILKNAYKRIEQHSLDKIFEKINALYCNLL